MGTCLLMEFEGNLMLDPFLSSKMNRIIEGNLKFEINYLFRTDQNKTGKMFFCEKA